MRDEKMVCEDCGSGVGSAVGSTGVENMEAGDVAAREVVRKLRKAVMNAEKSGAEYMKVPVGKYVKLLRDAEATIRELYGKKKVAQAQAKAARCTPKVYREVDPKRFPSRLRAARKAAGWTQGDLARRACLSYTTVCHLERGTRIPKWYRVEELAEALGCDANWLGASKEVVVKEEKE